MKRKKLLKIDITLENGRELSAAFFMKFDKYFHKKKKRKRKNINYWHLLTKVEIFTIAKWSDYNNLMTP